MAVQLGISSGTIRVDTQSGYTMTYDSFDDLEQAIERGVRAEISTRSIDQWREDLITHQLVSVLRRCLRGQVAGRVATYISAAAFKAAGKVETDFGDLAIIVRIDHHDGTHLEGVAFLEAKRVEWAGTQLESVRKDQLERQHKNLWNGRLLMYDKNPITGHAMDVSPDEAPWEDRVRYTHAATVPLGVVLATGHRSTSLYKFALPFAHQVAKRYVLGLDLEHHPETVSRAKATKEGRGAPAHVLAVVVGVGVDARPPEAVLGINRDQLVAMDEVR